MAATDLGKVGIVMKGTWSSSATYENLDAVSYNGGLYIAKQAVPANTLPTNTTYWQPALTGNFVTSIVFARHIFASTGTMQPGEAKTITEDVSATIPSGYTCIGAIPEYSGDDQFTWSACVYTNSSHEVSIIVRNDSGAADSGVPRANLVCIM